MRKVTAQFPSIIDIGVLHLNQIRKWMYFSSSWWLIRLLDFLFMLKNREGVSDTIFIFVSIEF